MRRSISKIPYRCSTAATFSTSSGGGGAGRGRGRGAPIQFQFAVSDDESKTPKSVGAHPPPHGDGHGRGRGSSSALPSFSSFMNKESAATTFARGTVAGENSEIPPPKPNPKMPFVAQPDPAESDTREKPLPSSIFGVLSGAGRGRGSKSQAQPPPLDSEMPRAAEARPTPNRAREQRQSPRVQLTAEEKVNKAVGILSRGGDGGRPGGARGGVRAEGGGRGGYAGGRGGGGGGGRGRGGYGGRGYDDMEDSTPTGKFYGDPADEEKVAKRLGPEVMSKLAEGLQEATERMLPSPADDALLDAYETNIRLECEPEYFMEEFGTNPDIDEKPPIPLRDALEKMKPFLMAYEGIESHEEWEEIMEETMKRVPLLKTIVDHYGGPDKVTAKQQNEELERVAKTLPASAPDSVRRFTDRAVLSLQSNAGWGFDKKCKLMDKLIVEVSQQYK